MSREEKSGENVLNKAKKGVVTDWGSCDFMGQLVQSSRPLARETATKLPSSLLSRCVQLNSDSWKLILWSRYLVMEELGPKVHKK